MMKKFTAIKTTIYQNQTGLHIRDGRIIQALGSGTYRTYGFRNEAIIVYPAYTQSFTYSVTVTTRESVLITISATMNVTIENAEKLFVNGKSAYEVINHAITRQFQEFIGSQTLAELLETEIVIEEARLNHEISVYGLAAIVMLAPKIRLPRNLQNAIDAQEVARQRAKAELEEARGRTAVIRHYANTAKVTQDNPDLLRLLLGQKAKSINVAFDAIGRTKV